MATKQTTMPKKATRTTEPETVTKTKAAARTTEPDNSVARRLAFEEKKQDNAPPPQSGSLPPLPDEKSQSASSEWMAKVKVPEGLIKQRGEGRTVDAVRKDMACYKLGADTMEKKMSGMLIAPKPTKEAQAAYVQEHLGDGPERKKALPLTGSGRTTEAVAEDINLVIAGAMRLAASGSGSLPPLPDEKSQSASSEWMAKVKVPEGLIKQRGEGRTVDAVRKDMACYKLGADTMEKKMSGMLIAPEPTKEAQVAYVQEHLSDVPERERVDILPLTGSGRTAPAVAADIDLVIAGAKHVAAQPQVELS